MVIFSKLKSEAFSKSALTHGTTERVGVALFFYKHVTPPGLRYQSVVETFSFTLKELPTTSFRLKSRHGATEYLIESIRRLRPVLNQDKPEQHPSQVGKVGNASSGVGQTQI